MTSIKNSRLCEIAVSLDFVDGFNGGIGCRIESYRVVSASKVIINSTRDADRRNSKLFIKNVKTGKRTIATDGYQRVDAVLLQRIRMLFSSFFRAKFPGLRADFRIVPPR